jgi:NAD(P)-dependent dehydrogenase (short-subunit alcohol dehydrogenase family)
MELGLSGRSAVITGASKGIGLAVAESLAREGCSLQLVARTQDTLEKAAATLRDRYGASVASHALDLSDSASIPTLYQQTGVPDILVNNAGAIPGGDLQAIDENTWRTAWDLKVFGYINACRQYYQGMKQRGSGVIVNVTGLAADRIDSAYIAGTTGNAGLNAFTRALGSVSLEDGVRVLAVSPGPVQTDRLVGLMKTKARDQHGDENRWQDFFGGLPMGRAARVEEIADVVTFLASDRASYVSGVILTVDGGHGSRSSSFTR